MVRDPGDAGRRNHSRRQDLGCPDVRRVFREAYVTTLTHRPPASAPDAGGDPTQQWNDTTAVAALIAKHLAGDPKAFPSIVGRYQVRLLNFIYRMIGDRER